ncbi:hypothetical protein BHM03_00011059 [Ensete ventricosum]|nr:hypothetical protein BHM03_00011059 [Ensete ventricosum]
MQAVFSFVTMQLQLCAVFFTFSLGTRTHYFGRTILHGGAKSHIQTLRGKILETILSLRFFIFQYGIVYKLHLTGADTSLAVSFILVTSRLLAISVTN